MPGESLANVIKLRDPVSQFVEKVPCLPWKALAKSVGSGGIEPIGPRHALIGTVPLRHDLHPEIRLPELSASLDHILH
jgi:hypothetical protein